MSIFNNKKLKELQSENEELKRQIEGFNQNEKQLKHFDELIKNAHLEYADIISKKDQTAQKLELLDRDKTRLRAELNKLSTEIKQLREMKLTEQNQLTLLKNAFENPNQVSVNENNDFSKSKQLITSEIEAAENRKNSIALDIFNLRKKFDNLKSKISDGRKVIEQLNADIEKKKEEISSLINRQRALTQSEKEIVRPSTAIQNEEIETRIKALIKQENELLENISSHKKQLYELGMQIEDKKLVLNREIAEIDPSTDSSQTEMVKKELILELDIKTEARLAQLASLSEELKIKTDLNKELQSENKELLDIINSRKEELAKLNESIEIDTIRLTDLDYSLNVLESEFENLKEDIGTQKSLRKKIESQIKLRSGEKVDLEDLLKELKETTTILARLKNDIERGTGQSAKRFTGILQYYSTMINDLYKKKSYFEKTLAQKEKELGEKQRLIEERQLTLSEMENILYIRYNRVGIIKDLTHAIANQRKLLEKSSFIPLNTDQKDDLVVSRNISRQKLINFENALKEILGSPDKYSFDLINKRLSFEKDIFSSKSRLSELNQNIRHAARELSELKNSISKIKAEHEDHRLSINKLAAIKTKFEEQIESYKKILDKYAIIREKIREEQELIKKKRDLAERNSSPTQTVEAQNTKWVKV